MRARFGVVVGIGLLVLGPSAGAAQEDLGLKDALAMAVRGNRELAIAALEVRATEARVETAEGDTDWVLGGQGVFERAINAFFGPVTQLTTQLSLSRKLYGNGVLTLRGDLERTDFDLQAAPGEAPVGQRAYVASVTLGLTQPLLRGAGAATADAPLRRARTDRDVARLRSRQRVTEIVRQIVVTYWELAFATQDVQIRRVSLDLARDQLRLTQAKVAIGAQGRVAVAVVEQAIAQREAEAIVAETAALDRSLQLRRLLGLPIAPGLGALRARDEPAMPVEAIDVQKQLALALAQNPALAAVRLGVRRAALDVEVTARGRLPQLDVSAFGGPTGDGSRTEVPPTDLGDALERTVDRDQARYGGAVTLGVPLGNHAAAGAHSAARLTRQRAELSAEELEQETTAAVISATAHAEAAARRIELTRAGTRAAEQSLGAERTSFEVGQSTNHEVLLRQEELERARLAEVRAAVDYRQALAEVEALSSSIVDRYGLTLGGSAAGPSRAGRAAGADRR